MLKKMFIEIRLCNPMNNILLKAMSESLKYTWWSLMYQFFKNIYFEKYLRTAASD